MRKRLLYLSAVCLAAVACGSLPKSDTVDYYLKGSSPKSFDRKVALIAAGQSNIDGRVPYDQMPEWLSKAQPIQKCLYVKNSEKGPFEPVNITERWAFDLVTYYHLAQVSPQPFYVIKWTQGGTSIDPKGDNIYHWTADYEQLESPEYSLLQKFENEIRWHVAQYGSDFDIRAFIWHQGESDRGDLGTGSHERYYDNFRNLIAYVRGIVGNPHLPVIAGSISHHSEQYDPVVEAAQKRIASEDPDFVLIDMSGAAMLDPYHFDAAANIYLGEMVFNALIDLGIFQGRKLNPVRPW